MVAGGLALRTYTSGEYRFVSGELKRSKKVLAVRGLNLNHNMTWAGTHSEHFRSLQSPGEIFLLTFPFIERRNLPSRYYEELLLL